jgi:hypothetical protein
MQNPFQSIPARYRQALYFAYALAGVALGVLAVYDVDVSKHAAALVVIGTALGLTAGANTDVDAS